MPSFSSVSYRDRKWYDKRRSIIERDRNTCIRCGEQCPDNKLQVHHLHYFVGRKPWEYEDFELITLCKHCHAEEHGHIKPSFGWVYEGMDDLEDLIGECEYCHTPIRYAHLISHPDWGFLTVGSQCAEKLTSESGISDLEEEAKKLARRYKRYLLSPKWEHHKNGYFMDFENFRIKIWEHGTYCNLEIVFPLWNKKTGILRYEKRQSSRRYAKIEDAKTQAFKVITDGSLIRFCERHYQYDSPHRPMYNFNNEYD